MEILFGCAFVFYVIMQNVTSSTTPLKRPRPGDPFDSYPKNFWQEFSSPFTDNPDIEKQPHTETSTEGRFSYFTDGYSTNNITSHLNTSIYLSCRVGDIRGKTVSWMRRKGDELTLLTFGRQTYSSDSRYSLKFKEPNDWRLHIEDVRKEDEGPYECQVSSYPPTVLFVNLRVVEPHIDIFDERLTSAPEKFYKAGSTIELHCILSDLRKTDLNLVWKHGNKVLNYDVNRGGISVKTEKFGDYIISRLFIANSDHHDSGNYTCALNNDIKAVIILHVLTEHPAAMQHSGVISVAYPRLFAVFIIPAVWR